MWLVVSLLSFAEEDSGNGKMAQKSKHMKKYIVRKILYQLQKIFTPKMQGHRCVYIIKTFFLIKNEFNDLFFKMFLCWKRVFLITWAVYKI